MEKYTEGGVSAIISGHNKSALRGKCSGATPKKNVPVTSSSTEKNSDAFVPSAISSKREKKKKKNESVQILSSGIPKELPVGDHGDLGVQKNAYRKRKFPINEVNKIQNNIHNELPHEKKKRKDYDMSNSVRWNNEKINENSGYDTNGNEMTYVEESYNRNDAADQDERTVFVGNLPLSYDHKKVVKLFSKFGPVASARIRCVPVPNISTPKKKTAIMKNFHPNRKSAVAYVVFKSKESVSKAIGQNGLVVDGHHLRIDFATPQKKDFKKSIFVGGLPFDVEDEELWETFQHCGEINDVRIIRDDKISMGKGFGYVNFKSSASVELALKLNGQEIRNRKINIQRCKEKKKLKNSVNAKKLRKTVAKRTERNGRVSKSHKISSGVEFQGRKAELKQKKKKKKLTRDAMRKNVIKSAFHSSPKKKLTKKN